MVAVASLLRAFFSFARPKSPDTKLGSEPIIAEDIMLVYAIGADGADFLEDVVAA